MSSVDHQHEMPDPDTQRIGAMATRFFLKIEIFAYIILGLLLAATALIGILSATISLADALKAYGQADAIVITIDRLLFVLMLVEILHTVRVSFRSGTLICEPFLIVGLIASIRRVLVITLESSQVNEPGKWSIERGELLHATMQELAVLGGLILVMVISIWVLRHSERVSPDRRD